MDYVVFCISSTRASKLSCQKLVGLFELTMAWTGHNVFDLLRLQ